MSAAASLKAWRQSPARMVRELFGVQPDKWQEEALERFPESRRICLKACAGPGKAQPDTLVIDTPAGKRRWGDLKIGDLVFAQDGTPTRIAGVYPRGRLPMYRVVFDDGTSTLACAEHLWKVRGRTERRHFKARAQPRWNASSTRRALGAGFPITPADGYSVLSTEQIITRNELPDGARRQFEIPQQEAALYPHASLALDPYVLGAWLGDGGRTTARGSWRDAEIDSEIERRGYSVGRTDEGRAVTVYGIVGHLRALGVLELYSYDRFIPDAFKYSSVEQRTALLAGLMDTDGTIGDDGSMAFDVTSKRLVDDVAWLVRSLGGVAIERKAKDASYRHRHTSERIQCRTCYRLTVTLPFNPFYVERKRARWRRPQERYLTRYIDRIEAAETAEASCIEVEHPSSCYLTNDFIVTHNTAVLAWLGWNFLLTRPHPAIGATSITGDNLKTNLWTELSRWYSQSPLLQSQFAVTKQKIYSRTFPDTWWLEARSWPKDADANQIGNALAGLHSKYVMWLLDESGDYPDAIMPVCEGIFSGGPVEAHIVQAGNPTRLAGPLYRACTVARDLWEVIEITADPKDPNRTPRVSIEIAEEQIRQYGADNPWVLVRIFGRFPPSSLNALIGPDDVSAAFKRYWRDHDIGNASRVLGVDVARFGDDQSVIYPRWGIQGGKPLKLRNVDSVVGAGFVSREWQDFGADACFIDMTGGWGTGWYDNLTTMGRTPIGVNFGGQAHQPQRYANKRSEMYFDAVEWIKRGGALYESDELLAALTQTTYTFERGGDRLLLEPKAQIKVKLGYSPDEADAFVTTFAEPILKENIRLPRVARHQFEYDPFASSFKVR